MRNVSEYMDFMNEALSEVTKRLDAKLKEARELSQNEIRVGAILPPRWIGGTYTVTGRDGKFPHHEKRASWMGVLSSSLQPEQAASGSHESNPAGDSDMREEAGDSDMREEVGELTPYKSSPKVREVRVYVEREDGSVTAHRFTGVVGVRTQISTHENNFDTQTQIFGEITVDANEVKVEEFV